MIYLIGGAPHCGKSTLATKLARRLHICSVATVTMESVVIRHYTKPWEIQKYFPKTWIRRQARTKMSNDVLFGKTSARVVARALIRQSRAIWDAIGVFVDCEVQACRDIIVEGYHVHPRLVSAMRKKYGKKNVRAVFLTRHDREKIVHSCSLHPTQGNDWFTQKSGARTKVESIGSMVVLFSQFLEKEARRYRCRIIATDLQYKKGIRDALNSLAK